MATRGNLLMLCNGSVLILISLQDWTKFHLCVHPLKQWILVDVTVFVFFWLLICVKNTLAARMGLNPEWQQRYVPFCGRIVVLSVIALLCPFICVWTVIGTFWFTDAKSCLSKGLKLGFIYMICHGYGAMVGVASLFAKKWFRRRRALILLAQQGNPFPEHGVLVDMIRVPELAFEAAFLETSRQWLYAAIRRREAALFQELPKCRLKTVPTNCSECPICLEELMIGDEVCNLPCEHNFHVDCIGRWLRLNAKCPRCSCYAFSLALSTLSNIRS